MKKKILIFTVIIVLVTATVFGVCTQLVLPHEHDAENISVFLSSKLKRDFCNFIDSDGRFISPDEVWVARYYGRYSGCDVVVMNGESLVHDNWEYDITLAGYNFTITATYFYVYKNGDFYGLQEAFNKGFLTDSDWGKLHGVMYG